jgi:hypothetical protein
VLNSARRILILLFTALAAACNSPTWRFDKIPLEATWQGDKCTLLIDGRQAEGRAKHRGVAIEESLSVISQPGYSVRGYECGGLGVSVQTRAGVPTKGTYRVARTDGIPPADGASLLTDVTGIGAGLWPLNCCGVDVEGVSGTVRIDSVGKVGIWAEIHATGSRRARGF